MYNFLTVDELDRLRHAMQELVSSKKINVNRISTETGVGRDKIRAFLGLLTNQAEPRNFNDHRDATTIINFLSRLGYLDRNGFVSMGVVEEEKRSVLLHPELVSLFQNHGNDDVRDIAKNFSGLYFGVGVGRKQKYLVPGFLGIGKNRSITEYMQYDLNPRNQLFSRGQVFAMNGGLVLVGTCRKHENVEIISFRFYDVVDGVSICLEGSEYHSGFSTRGSGVSKVIFVRVETFAEHDEVKLDDKFYESDIRNAARVIFKDVDPNIDSCWEKVSRILAATKIGKKCNDVQRVMKNVIEPINEASLLFD